MKKVNINITINYDHAQEVGKLICTFPEMVGTVKVMDDNKPPYVNNSYFAKTENGYIQYEFKAVGTKKEL